MQRNVATYYIVSVLSGASAGFMHPVLVLYFLSVGVGIDSFMGYQSVLFTSALLLEVPAGVVADRYSRRLSLIVGRSCHAIATLIALLSADPLLLLTLFLLFGAGESFVSGADSALIYDSIDKDTYLGVAGNAAMAHQWGMVAGSLICAAVSTKWGLSAPIVLSLAGRVVSAFASGFFVENRRSEGKSLSGEARSYGAHIRKALREYRGNGQLVGIVFVGICVSRIVWVSDRPFAQPYLEGLGHSVSDIGIVYAGMVAAAGIGSKIAGRMPWDPRWSIVAALIGVTAGAVAYSSTPGWAIVSLVSMHAWRGVATPPLSVVTNERISSEVRASCLSFNAMASSLVSAMIGPAIGFYYQLHGVEAGLAMWANWSCGALVVSLILVMFLKRLTVKA